MASPTLKEAFRGRVQGRVGLYQGGVSPCSDSTHHYFLQGANTTRLEPTQMHGYPQIHTHTKHKKYNTRTHIFTYVNTGRMERTRVGGGCFLGGFQLCPSILLCLSQHIKGGHLSLTNPLLLTFGSMLQQIPTPCQTVNKPRLSVQSLDFVLLYVPLAKTNNPVRRCSKKKTRTYT